MILEFARGTVYDVGSNPQGAPGPPLWLFLLPSLERIEPCVVGDVPHRVTRGLEGHGLRPLRSGSSVPQGCRLLLVGRRALADGATHAWLRAAGPEVSVWANETELGEVASALGSTDATWLLPEGRPRTTSPRVGARLSFRIPTETHSVGLAARARRVATRAMHRLGIGRAGIAKSGAYRRPLVPGGPPSVDMSSQGALFLPAATAAEPPAWLLDIARAGGVDLAGRDWSITPPSGFRSQKVLFGFGPPRGAANGGGIAVKVTQDAMFNARLLNEYHGLAALAERASLPERMVPRPVFLGTHGGLAVVAESMLPGSPFPLHSSGQADCPTAARAIEGIGRLAAATARPATGADHAKAIADLVAHLREIYRPDAELLGSVEEALGALARAGTVPTVFLHGDPGDWNLLVAPDGEIGFLDWENSETEGPPLWDLFWFVHSYAGFAAERSGIRATPAACARRLLEPTAEAEAMVRATRGLALRLGVDVAAIEPLFVLHAVAMAVREAWRLPPEDPGRGRCFGWLREVVARRASSPILARLRSTD